MSTQRDIYLIVLFYRKNTKNQKDVYIFQLILYNLKYIFFFPLIFNSVFLRKERLGDTS